MTAYELTLKTNHHLIKGNTLTEQQKANVTRQLLAARSSPEEAQRFYRGVRFPGNIDGGGRRMYPVYFIPPYDGGKKLQTIIPMSPKTHILSANAYELEIIRLLHLLAPDNPVIQEMVCGTLARLKTTCFAYHNCVAGECFHAGLITLRFLAAAATDEMEWMKRLNALFNEHIDEKLKNRSCNGGALWYYWLCLSELPAEIAGPELPRHREKMLRQLNRGFIIKNESDGINRPVMICALRNAVARLPEYAHVKERRPYV